MNGHLKKHSHGTRNVLPQLINNLEFHQSVLDQKYNAESHADEVRGKVKPKKLNAEFIQALQEGNCDTTNDTFVVSMRYKHRDTLFQTIKNSDKKKDSSVCKFISKKGVIKFGSIYCFCLCGGNHIAIMNSFETTKDAFEDILSSNIEKFNSLARTKPCFFKVYGPMKLHAVPVASILSKCVHIPMKTKTYDYIIPIPNPFEHH